MEPLSSQFHALARVLQHLALTLLMSLGLVQIQALDWQTETGFRFAPLPIQPASSPSHHTGFTSLPPDRTGIHFTNSLGPAQILENNNYMNGSGIAAGDVDGDGRCDLYFCSITGTNALYRNLGDWRFERVAPGNQGLPELHSTGAVFADVDGDSDLDLLVATLGHGVQCLLNSGKGQFENSTLQSGLVSTNGTTSLALADIDGDGDLDLYAANYGEIPIMRSGTRVQVKKVQGETVISGPHAHRLRMVNGQLREVGEPDVLYLNDGRGHFSPVPWDSNRFVDEQGRPQPPPFDFGLSVQFRDLNGDGAPEIYVCNDFESPDRLWINDGTGHFRAAPTRSLRKQSFASMGVDFADVDRDGRVDFFVSEMLARDPSRRLRQVFSFPGSFGGPGDLDSRPQVTRNTLQWNRGDGTFGEVANYAGLAASDWSWACAFLDVDLDGYEDLLVATGMPLDILDRDTLQRIRSLGRIPMAQAKTNLLTFPPLHPPNAAFRNRGGVRFEEVGNAWHFDSERISNGMALADLDGDGDLDVALNCLQDGPLLYRNESIQPRIQIRLRGLAGNPAGIGASVRVSATNMPTQIQEVICGGRYLSGDDPVRVFAASPTGGALHRLEVTWRGGKRSVIEQVVANRVYEVMEPADTTSQAPDAPANTTPRQPWFRELNPPLEHRHTESAFNDFVRQPLLPKLLSRMGPPVAWFDLDDDGTDELLVGTGAGGDLAVYRVKDSARFERWIPSGSWKAPDDVVAMTAMVAPDGSRALWMSVAKYELLDSQRPMAFSLRGNTPTNSWQIQAETAINGGPESPGPIAAADLDGTGELAVFVGGRVVSGAYPTPTSSHVFRRHQGVWKPDVEAAKALANVGLVTDALWSDLDADGRPELVLTLEWGAIHVLRHRGTNWERMDPNVQLDGKTLPLSALTGWWNGVGAGDFDGDGRMDLVASNWGLNDLLFASAQAPLELFFGRVPGSEGLVQIETQQDTVTEKTRPRLAYEVLSQSIPGLAGAFGSNQEFSTATVSEILAKLPGSWRHVHATTLASMIFLNRGNSFEARLLPKEAQWAPAFAVRVADADGDGHEDVFLSQNFFGVRPENGRLDAGQGLWLRGDGSGSFEAIPSSESGIRIDGEQRGAALADFNRDGRIDLVVTQNGAATRVYENLIARPGVRVKLKGSPGNPWGIGARIWLEYQDGRMGPSRELHSGGGYGSLDSLVTVLALPKPAVRVHVAWPGGRRTATPVAEGQMEVEVLTEAMWQERSGSANPGGK
jgi:hypothetical protein